MLLVQTQTLRTFSLESNLKRLIMGCRQEREDRGIQKGAERTVRINMVVLEQGIPREDRAGSLASKTWGKWKGQNLVFRENSRL